METTTNTIKNLAVETWLPLFNGFYNTNFDMDDSDIENEIYEINRQRSENGLEHIEYDDMDIDYEQYQKDVVIYACSKVEDFLRDLGIDTEVKFQGIDSPKEYNFRNDSGNVLINIDKKNVKVLINLIYKNMDDIEQYLKDNYTSCSGFISSYPNSFVEWEQETDNFTTFNKHQLGAILEALLISNGYSTESITDTLCENIYAPNYIKNYNVLENGIKCFECDVFFVLNKKYKEEYDLLIKKGKEYFKEYGKKNGVFKAPQAYTFEGWLYNQDENYDCCKECRG